jgi:beta-1,4-mannosyl-glycoprotein beta-1,4-N-acetylglucosaminyltransferase
MFFNELDLLELRLNEYDDVVDHFLIVEATKTFSGKSKPLYFQENYARYKNFLNKIIHRVVDNMPSSPNRWDLENFQRDAMLDVCRHAQPEDIIIMSDADELWNKECLKNITLMPCVFNQFHFYYYLNYLVDKKWRGSIITLAQDLQVTTPVALRNLRDLLPFIMNGGWHFAYLGGAENIKLKIESYSHAEFDTHEIKSRIPDRLECLQDIVYHSNGRIGEIVPIDKTFPSYLLNHIYKFQHLIYRK